MYVCAYLDEDVDKSSLLCGIGNLVNLMGDVLIHVSAESDKRGPAPVSQVSVLDSDVILDNIRGDGISAAVVFCLCHGVEVADGLAVLS